MVCPILKHNWLYEFACYNYLAKQISTGSVINEISVGSATVEILAGFVTNENSVWFATLCYTSDCFVTIEISAYSFTKETSVGSQE